MLLYYAVFLSFDARNHNSVLSIISGFTNKDLYLIALIINRSDFLYPVFRLHLILIVLLRNSYRACFSNSFIAVCNFCAKLIDKFVLN